MSKEERDRLITDNMSLVYYLIRKYYPSHIKNEDVIQEGMIGLINAVDNWDENKSTLSTYATNCIINQIRMYFRQEMKQLNCKSLDELLCNDESNNNLTLSDTLPGGEDVDLDSIIFEMFLETLSKEELELVEMLKSMTQREIGEVLGISRALVAHRKKLLGRKWRKFNGDN